MTLRERMEGLRGEPIAVSQTRPEDFPCNETSDPSQLPAKPTVSVCMTAYNHAAYVARAIEGVLAQEADFDYELVIGEDCSPDATRQICLDYQRRFPNRVRVLWSDANLHREGGNVKRILARCRGEFIAFCEGDDYWTDPRKLARQVALLRRYPTAGACFSGVDFLEDATGEMSRYDAAQAPEEFLPGRDFCRRMIADGGPGMYLQAVQTSGFMVRRDVLRRAAEDFRELYSWCLRLRDYFWFLGAAALADVCFLRTACSVYRMNDGGVTRRNAARLMRDGDVVRVAFAMQVFGMDWDAAVAALGNALAAHWIKAALREDADGQRAMGRLLGRERALDRLLRRWHCRALYAAIRAGRLTKRRYRLLRPLYALGAHLAKRKAVRLWSSR